MVRNTPPSLSPFLALPSIPRGLGGEDEGKRRELERGREEEEEETYVLQFAAIKLCKFAVIRENLSIFAVIKKNVAAITPFISRLTRASVSRLCQPNSYINYG